MQTRFSAGIIISAQSLRRAHKLLHEKLIKCTEILSAFNVGETYQSINTSPKAANAN